MNLANIPLWRWLSWPWRALRQNNSYFWPDTRYVATPVSKQTLRLGAAAIFFALMAAFHGNPLAIAANLGIVASGVFLAPVSRLGHTIDRALTWAIWIFTAVVCGVYFTQPTMRFSDIVPLLYLLAFFALAKQKHGIDIVALTIPSFLLLTHGFISEDSLITAGFSIVGVVFLLMALSSATQPMPAWKHSLKIGRLVLYAVPWVLALFVLFPRMPFGQSPPLNEPLQGSTGLSDSMTPGNISSLVQSLDPAFNARFDNRLPTPNDLYWRAAVFDRFDGRTWNSAPTSTVKIAPLANEKIVAKPYSFSAYTSVFFAPLGKQLPTLDGTLPGSVRFETKANTVLPIMANAQASYSLPSRGLQGKLTAVAQLDESGTIAGPYGEADARHLALPEGGNPKTKAMANEWSKQAGNDPDKLLKRFRTWINSENFHYTLKPPLLGDNAVDQFLFASRSGFCEHYASAFVVFMRMAGVPARVVTGYQGGDVDVSQNTVRVLSKNAHAWAEIHTSGAWHRVDPTAFIHPSRIDPDTLNPGQSSWSFLGGWGQSMQRWGASMTLLWKERISDFDAEKQQSIIQKFGVPSHAQHLFTLLAFIALALLFAIGYHLHPKQWLNRSQASTNRPYRRLTKKSHRALGHRRAELPDNATPTQLIDALTPLASAGDENSQRLVTKLMAYRSMRYDKPRETFHKKQSSI